MTRERVIVFAARVYGTLLRLYPPEFRQRYGEEMLQAFRDLCRDNANGLARFWLAALADLLVSAIAERAKQMLTRRWLFKALSSSGAGAVYLLSWFVLAVTVMLITYFMLVPWDEGVVPTGTFATAVNNLFESNLVWVPTFIVTFCEIIAITRITRRRMYSAARIYAHFFALNTLVVIISAPVAQFSMILIGRVFPQPAPFVIDPNYGTAAVYWGLIVVGTILAFFIRLAWRPPTLPLTRQHTPPTLA